MRFIVAALFLLLSQFAHAVAEGELLEPEQAFKFSAQALDANTLEVRYQIADGYYLYRNKFKFQVQPESVTLGTPQFPSGQIKQDEFFGKMEIYHKEIRIKLPLQFAGSAPRSVMLSAVSQGCAEAGVCYPPMTQKAEISLPAMAVPTPRGGGLLESLQRLGGGGGGDAADEFLPPEQAFSVSLKPRDANSVEARFEVAKGYYLYRQKISFKLNQPAGASLPRLDFPKGETKQDPNFGQTEVYHQPFSVVLNLSGVKAGEMLSLVAGYQGCAEKGVCYPPASKTLTLTMAGAAASAPATPDTPAQAVAAPAETPVATAEMPQAQSESARIDSILKHGSFWVVVASFFGFGLLLALTPCVFPMIPILSSIIVGEGHSLTRRRSFGLSVVYVLGMAITYALAGVAAGMSGTLISNALQNPWALGTGALIFVLLALSMFGFYDLQMPSFIQSKVSEEANRLKGGKYWAVFVMGALSALIVGPCVAAPLAGALMYIGQTGNLLLGGTALFVMALGMGAPLLLVGLSAGSLLPHAGAWMQGVKNFFGVAMLGIAIWLISPLISSAANMLLWSALLIISAIHLHAIDPLPPGATGWKKFWKGVGVISLVSGVALLIGVLAGSRDILQPLGTLRPATATAGQLVEHGLKFERVNNVAELESRLQAAKGKTVMLDFYADWCVSCKELERFTFSDAKVRERLQDTVLLQADVTANSAEDKALLARFGLFGPPGIILFDRNGQEISAARVIGYQPPEQFLQTLALLK